MMLAIVLFTVPVAAAVSNGNVSTMSLGTSKCNLEINAITAKASATTTAIDSDSISIMVCLQKYKDGAWTTVKSKTDSTTSDSLTVSLNKIITVGSFRAKSVSTIKEGTKTET